MDPVYPKEDPEYRKRVMEQFYKKVRETNWDSTYGEYQGKPRGRKAKQTTRIESKPRTLGERQALEKQSQKKQNKYNWL
jgi:hypothetical protein